MIWLKSTTLVTTGLLAATLGVSSASPAIEDTLPEQEVIDAIVSAEPDVDFDLGEAVAADGAGFGRSAKAEQDQQLLTDDHIEGVFGEGSSLVVPGGTDVETFQQTSTGAQVLSGGLGDGIDTVLVERDEGDSLQIFTVIDESSDAERFSYEFKGFDVRQIDEALIATSADGGEWMLAPAWAKDANGASVPTHYELNESNTLVQVVDHVDGDYAYPIVADPFLGQNLFKNLHRDKWKNDYRYNGSLTAFGWVVYTGAGYVPGLAAGQVVLNNQGWNEWRKKWPAITNKATLRQQFSCHALGAIGAGEWNLERARKNQPNWHSWFTARCNW